MSNSINNVCPVCGGSSGSLLKERKSPYACASCGFSWAFPGYYASPSAKRLWNEKAEKSREAIENRKREDLRAFIRNNNKTRLLFLGNDCAAFCLPSGTSGLKKLFVVSGNGEIRCEDNAILFHVSERNTAVLKGQPAGAGFLPTSLLVLGDNSYGQCSISNIKNVTAVTTTPTCTYLVTEDGTVETAGSPVSPSVREWTDIQDISCGAYHVLGLKKNGQVLLAGQMLEQHVKDAVASWKDVKMIYAATDCSLALTSQGNVLFAGRDTDPRRTAASWKGVVSIAADSSYAVGLTEDGQVLIAGSCKAFLDMGRSEAAQWKDMIAIACSKSGIAAIDRKGHLHLAGNFTGDAELVKKKWDEEICPLISQMV